MNQPKSARDALIVLMACYLLLVVPMLLWTNIDNGMSVLWTGICSPLALGIALELTELILALLWPPRSVPLSGGSIDRGSIAVLMTICDDIDLIALESLIPLAEAGYPVYLLDDSRGTFDIPTNVLARVKYGRRGNQRGHKAGNLNDWLSIYGDQHDSIVLLDADSIMSPQAVDALARAAEHPANVGTAIFQSKIESRCPVENSILCTVLGLAARPRARILERVHGRLGIGLSQGHNQLVRLDALRLVGGFDEAFSCEDTALSLALSSRKLRIELVDAWSCDSEPRTVESWVRRTVRWARQTVELFHGDWATCPLRIKLTICRHLLSYLLPGLAIGVLLFSLLTPPLTYDNVLAFYRSAFFMDEGFGICGFSLWSTVTVFCLCWILRSLLALKEGVAPRALVEGVVFGPALHVVLIAPVLLGMLMSAFGARTAFTPTNIRRGKEESAAIGQAILRCLPALIIGLGFLVCLMTRPWSGLVGLSGLWLAAYVSAPVTLSLLLFHDCKQALGGIE